MIKQTTMTMKKFLFIFLLLWLGFSCKNSKNSGEQTVSYKYELEAAADKELKYPLGNDIEFMFGVLFPYIDKSGKEYLTFRSRINNSILFYDLPTGKYLFDMKLELEGPNAAGRCDGYYIEDLDNIYLTPVDKFGLVKVDTAARVKQFIKYGKTNNGYEVLPIYRSRSFNYNPMVIYNTKLYITQHPFQAQTSKVSETPLTIAIDTTAGVIKEHPFRFSDIFSDDDVLFGSFGRDFSRDFNGKQFIYSFCMDENIYITDIETEETKNIPVRSKYIKRPVIDKRPDDMDNIELAYKKLLEASCYRNLFYDKYRNVYYRFTHIGVEQEKEREYTSREIWNSGPAQFSVIILDKDFNIIGETLFPKYTYNSTIAFVHKNGLYICDSHILNPSFDEDVLSFKCFTLKENK
jgi:hypothetical protein